MTLIVYDNTGYIWNQISGNYMIPVGIPYLEVEVPEGKFLKGVDTTVSPHTPVFEKYPQTEIDLLKEQLATQEQAILELSMLIGGVV